MRECQRPFAIRTGTKHGDDHFHSAKDSAVAVTVILLEDDLMEFKRGDSPTFKLIQKILKK